MTTRDPHDGWTPEVQEQVQPGDPIRDETPRDPLREAVVPHFYTPDAMAMGDCRVCGHIDKYDFHVSYAVHAWVRAALDPSSTQDAPDVDALAEAVVNAMRNGIPITPKWPPGAQPEPCHYIDISDGDTAEAREVAIALATEYAAILAARGQQAT